MKRPVLILTVLGGLLAVAGGIVLAGILFFLVVGVSDEAMYFGSAAERTEMTMAAADSAAIEREEMAPAEAPAARVANAERG